jgi:flagellar motor switch protein FliG
MADKAELPDLDGNDALQAELEALSTTQRAAVLMLLLGEDHSLHGP